MSGAAVTLATTAPQRYAATAAAANALRFTGKMANGEIVVEQDHGRLIIREAKLTAVGPQHQF